MRPASRSSLRCWETVDWARGRRSTRPPHTQPRRPARISRMRRRTGWERALARPAARTRAGSNGAVFAWAMFAPVFLSYIVNIRLNERAVKRFFSGGASRVQ
ncbi:MAG: hypothetical protein MZV64_52660 [Ignavibacteriales bacterium]|nr:hypothetical protein [Ignavibacteriales bacterium]